MNSIKSLFNLVDLFSSKSLSELVTQGGLQPIFDQIDEGILLLDQSGEVAYLNKIAKSFLECGSKAELQNQGDKKSRDWLELFDLLGGTKENRSMKDQRIGEWTFDVQLLLQETEKLVILKDTTQSHRFQDYKSELISNLSHELKTPLSMIMGYAETLIKDSKIPKETSSRFLQKIYDHSVRINGIIRDVLELQKIDFIGEQFEVVSPVNVEDIISDMKTRFRAQESKELFFDVEVQEAYILYNHLFSILTNLVENAIKYSKGSSVYIDIHQTESHLIVKVEDEGPLIPLAERERIFERFYTVSRSRNRAISGTGLGLPICKHIAELYRGSITLTQGSKSGNLFEIVLEEKK